MMSNLITLEQLKEITRCKLQKDVETQLRKNGIRFLYGKTGVFTTLDAINAAMGLNKADLKPSENEISIL